jgi:hypothetical protein
MALIRPHGPLRWEESPRGQFLLEARVGAIGRGVRKFETQPVPATSLTKGAPDDFEGPPGSTRHASHILWVTETRPGVWTSPGGYSSGEADRDPVGSRARTPRGDPGRRRLAQPESVAAPAADIRERSACGVGGQCWRQVGGSAYFDEQSARLLGLPRERTCPLLSARTTRSPPGHPVGSSTRRPSPFGVEFGRVPVTLVRWLSASTPSSPPVLVAPPPARPAGTGCAALPPTCLQHCMRRREQHRDHPAVTHRQQQRPFAPYGVHHRTDVVHAASSAAESSRPDRSDRPVQARAPPVEQDQPRERGEPPPEGRVNGTSPSASMLDRYPNA